MRDIFSEGLLYLDLLEIYGSTYAVAEVCGIAQSNVFRGANACAKLLNLSLAKDKHSGTYKVGRNLDVQRDLRRLNQKMRAREHGLLRLVGAEPLLTGEAPSLEQAKIYQMLPDRWRSNELSLQWLEQSLLDVVVTRASQVRSRLPWPPPVRRRDLFVPIAPFAATELCELRILLIAKSNHPLIHSRSSFDSSNFPWLVDSNLPVDLIQEFYPSACLRSSQDPDLTSEAGLAQLQIDPELLWMTDSVNFASLKLADPSLDLQAIPLEFEVKDYLLAISLPALIVEPMHQSLIRNLRELAGRRTVAMASPQG